MSIRTNKLLEFVPPPHPTVRHRHHPRPHHSLLLRHHQHLLHGHLSDEVACLKWREDSDAGDDAATDAAVVLPVVAATAAVVAPLSVSRVELDAADPFHDWRSGRALHADGSVRNVHNWEKATQLLATMSRFNCKACQPSTLRLIGAVWNTPKLISAGLCQCVKPCVTPRLHSNLLDSSSWTSSLWWVSNA